MSPYVGSAFQECINTLTYLLLHSRNPLSKSCKTHGMRKYGMYEQTRLGGKCTWGLLDSVLGKDCVELCFSASALLPAIFARSCVLLGGSTAECFSTVTCCSTAAVMGVAILAKGSLTTI